MMTSLQVKEMARTETKQPVPPMRNNYTESEIIVPSEFNQYSSSKWKNNNLNASNNKGRRGQ